MMGALRASWAREALEVLPAQQPADAASCVASSSVPRCPLCFFCIVLHTINIII